MTRLLLTAFLAYGVYGQFMYAISNLTTTPMFRRQATRQVTLRALPGFLGESQVFQEDAVIEDNPHLWNDGARLFFQNHRAPNIEIYMYGHYVFGEEAECYPREIENETPFAEFYYTGLNRTQYRLSYQCTFITLPSINVPAAPPSGNETAELPSV